MHEIALNDRLIIWQKCDANSENAGANGTVGTPLEGGKAFGNTMFTKALLNTA